MRSITVLCVGKLKEAYWRDACAEYAKRLGAFCRFSLVEVEEERVGDRPSPAQIRAAVEAEGRRLLAKAGPALLIPLCIEGRELSSPALSRWLEEQAVAGKGDAAFVIGGSWGLSEEVKRAGTLRLSMSPMTFPHQLARVMLCEQIYRAMQISAGGKYHK
ncbi:MAG TPA: 23S rRNA (pseudouridine(1915)-N(3))-methyltransferase RlmH [Firmicutes bacterium]|nr:23S rRNA (pseudouridine(1915)-N(3))-methyltransferase RlmH [Bacillota bacterium]